jgi:hypothetical protein
MKARIRKTGEIVDVTRGEHGFYVDENCVGYTISELDFNEEKEHWQDVRERAAIAAMQGALANCYLHSVSNSTPCSNIARQSVLYADALIKELKKK